MLWICATAVPAKAQLSFVVIGANFTPLPVDLQQQGQHRFRQNPVKSEPCCSLALLRFALLMLMAVGYLSRAKRISVSLALSEKTSCDGVATLRYPSKERSSSGSSL